MQTHSFLQRHSHSESSDRVIASIKPRSWGDPPQHQATQPTRHNFSHIDLFAHDPGSRSISHGVQAKLAIGQRQATVEGEAEAVGEAEAAREAEADIQPKLLGEVGTSAVQRQAEGAKTETGTRRQPFKLHASDRPSSPVLPWWGIQTKLTIGQPNDAYEQEADQVAERVMSMAAPTTPSVQRQEIEDEEPEEIQTKPLAETITPLVQRQEEDEEPLQAKCEACEQEESIQRAADGVPQVQPDLEHRLNASQGGGSALPEAVRSFMEPRFGADFSQVRVHTGSEAVQMNRDLNAQAFTHKQDVYFGQGKAPANDALTAHELTHVVQQGKEIRRYRNTGAFNFGKRDGTTLIEDSFNVKKDKKTKPWIKQITVEFDSLNTDSGGNEYSSGTASVQYYDNPVKLPDFSFPVGGGSQTLGKTESGTFTVSRIEGIGYNSGSASGQPGVDFDPANREGPLKRYSKDLNANMSYAVFYNKGEALHVGSLNLSSHGCVHVDWAPIKQLNYHSVIGLTKVTVKYLSKEVKEARRVKKLNEDYENAIKSSEWEKAALLLNGFNDADILERVKRLNSLQLSQLRKGALKSMPGWSKRVTDSIDSVTTP